MTNGGEVAVKNLPPLFLAAAAKSFDPWWLIVIPLGLVIGTMAQTGRMVRNRRTWDDIKNELIVSALVGGANALLAALVIASAGLNYLQGLVIAALCAFGGVRTIEAAFAWAFRHFTQDAARLGRQQSEED